jgi:putative phosphonate metabolism protein
MPQRFALYYAPSVTDPLWLRAAQWLGRDPAGGAVAAVEIPGIDVARRIDVSESARRYGFHATLKAPMALAEGVTQAALEEALRRFGPDLPAVEIGKLKVASIDGFVALIPERQTETLTAFVARVVEAFDPFRAPLTAADREKRVRNGRLTPRQIELLDRFGYPYVMEEFLFHMTLTDRLVDADREEIMGAARDWFAPLLNKSYWLDCIALFHEPSPGAPFVRLGDYPLTEKARIDA